MISDYSLPLLGAGVGQKKEEQCKQQMRHGREKER
jgi:hypothetical protein